MNEPQSVPDAGVAPVILAGMHRSGTSYAASVLQAAGVAMGENMLSAARGNAKGHFEDLDFLKMHALFLEAHGQGEAGWTDLWPLDVPPELAEKGRALAAAKAAAFARGEEGQFRHWGWKDPRTTLFLEYWRSVLPAARFVLMYREPWEVADSLYRRASDRVIMDNPRLAIDLWTHYNRRVVEFVERHPQQSILISNDAATADEGGFVRAINARFGLSLAVPAEKLFDPDVMVRQETGSWREAVLRDLSPDALDVYQRLQSLSTMPGRAPAEHIDRGAIAPEIVRVWGAERGLQHQVKQLHGVIAAQGDKYGRVYSEMMGLRRHALWQKAVTEAVVEMHGRVYPALRQRAGWIGRMIGAATLTSATRWSRELLRPVDVAPDEENAIPENGLVVRHVLGGPFLPGAYVAKLRVAPGGGEVRVGLCHAGGAELAGASAPADAQGAAICKVTLGKLAVVACISITAGAQLTEFEMYRD